MRIRSRRGEKLRRHNVRCSDSSTDSRDAEGWNCQSSILIFDLISFLRNHWSSQALAQRMLAIAAAMRQRKAAAEQEKLAKEQEEKEGEGTVAEKVEEEETPASTSQVYCSF